MAMFLPESNAGTAMRSVGDTAARISGLTSMGAPSHPNPSVSIGTGGVSFMPVNAPPPTAVGGRPTPVQRIDPRKQVRFDKNPRVGLHYCVEIDADEEKPQVGELCFLDTTSAGGWTHPKLLTLNGVNAALCKVADAGGEQAAVQAAIRARLAQLSPVGVFNTDVMDVSSGYSGMHVAIDAQRYTTVRDYWPIDARAGDRLWITFSVKATPPASPAGTPAAKRVRCEKIRIQCLSARGYQQAKEAAEEPEYAVIAGICVGVVQNRLPADPVYGSAGKKCSFERSSASERKREIHLCLNENVWFE